ncbi:hypothetical protein BOTBODRAFT_146727 [Botryobasidium botryosum FD-172 SS1]|uniref:Uncharacterized protein n=1 Tax=Botryobasidium botryosum (strain FD-172 SS1) TaxID=930990 RepID=A0A067MCV2_BOTB1|nr:hypothetical protein BOTBODRAFT_146727 [Botryobasidium botryosum FD-172 SS1]
MKTFADEPWQQASKIIIAFDIGTTQAAVSFAYLYPGGKQTVHRVTEWPGQQRQHGASKIPSKIWYDAEGKPRAFGAEAESRRTCKLAEDGGWALAKHWKLHLHPSSLRSSHGIHVDPLPSGATIDKIYADFIGYLYAHTKRFFEVYILDGKNVWQKLESTTDFVIAHPNGWRLQEQAFLRSAAITAGLIDSEDAAKQRVTFVSEAEAAVHFVMIETDFQTRLQRGVELVICDAGGSTVDTTLYEVVELSPTLHLREKRTSACTQAGSIFVNKYAQEFISNKFRGTSLPEDEVRDYVTEFMEDIEMEKRSFDNSTEDMLIQVGGGTMADLGIRRGKYTLTGEQMRRWFDPLANDIGNSIEEQMRGHSAKYLFLVGGFGDSPYLRHALKSRSAISNISLTVTKDSNAKAVADGAVIWFAKSAVTGRATRSAFGTDVSITGLVPLLAMLGVQDRKVKIGPRGPFYEGGWSQIVGKSTVLAESEEKIETYCLNRGSPDPGLFSCTIYAYDGMDDPLFMQDASGKLERGFEEVCIVRADLSGMKGKMTSANGMFGEYWKMEVKVALRFGGTELSASILWEENGVTHRSPASVIPSSFV